VKTTLEIPDEIFRRAKTAAAERGISLERFITEAIDHLTCAPPRSSRRPAWTALVGELRDLRRESLSIATRIEDEFE